MQGVKGARQVEVENVPMPEPCEEDDGPQVAGAANRPCTQDAANLQENNDRAPRFDKLVSLLNT